MACPFLIFLMYPIRVVICPTKEPSVRKASEVVRDAVTPVLTRALVATPRQARRAPLAFHSLGSQPTGNLQLVAKKKKRAGEKESSEMLGCTCERRVCAGWSGAGLPAGVRSQRTLFLRAASR